MTTIKAIKIRGIRGIRGEVCLEPDGKSLLVQGDNGTGKSSMVQALAWALRDENAPSARGLSGEEAFRSHVLEKPESSRVEVVFSGNHRLTVSAGATFSASHATASDFRDSCTKADPFLRRSQLLQFLGQRPVDRFRYLESFLDLGEADDIRSHLAERAGVLKSRAEELQGRRRKGLQAIHISLPKERRPVADTWIALERAFVTWAQELGLVDSNSATWTEIESSKNKAKAAAEDNSGSKQRAQFELLQTQIGQMIEEVSSLVDVESVERELTEAVKRSTDGDLVRLPVSVRVVAA